MKTMDWCDKSFSLKLKSLQSGAMPQPPDAITAVAEMPTSGVCPSRLATRYLKDEPASEASQDLGAGDAAEPRLDSAGSAVAACQLNQPPSQPVPPLTWWHAPWEPQVDGQTSRPPASVSSVQDQPQSRRLPIDGHAAKNQNPEVGNFNIFFGNWGTRRQAGNMRGEKGLLHQNINRQIAKNPCIVITLAEATEDVASDLQHGYFNGGGLAPNALDDRPSYEHFVHRRRGDPEDTGVLIACRTDNTTGLNLLVDESNLDSTYREHGVTKPEITKTMICEVLFKQNVGHLGTKITIGVCHLNNRTAKGEGPQQSKIAFLDELALRITKFNIKFLTGDYNMECLHLIEALRSRGIAIDCVAWYPWYHRTVAPTREGPVGIDSCAIFYIGGNALVKLVWGLSQIDKLETAVADPGELDVYEGNACPGQSWTCYVPKGRTLRQHLEAFLTPSITKEELDRIEKTNCYCPYLRLKQKPMSLDFWLYQGKRHNGAHYPLVMQTQNASARSDAKERERNDNQKEKKRNSRYGGRPSPQSRMDNRSRGVHGNAHHAQPAAASGLAELNTEIEPADR